MSLEQKSAAVRLGAVKTCFGPIDFILAGVLFVAISGQSTGQEKPELLDREATSEYSEISRPQPEEVRLAGAKVVKDLTYATVDQQVLLCDVYLPIENAARSGNANDLTEPTIAGESNKEGEAGNSVVNNAVPSDAVDHRDGAAAETLRPAVVVIHGGGWAVGDKWSVSNYARTFAANGMVAISINYRHAPRYKFPAQVDDARAALVWIHDHAEQYRIDTNRIGIFGYSAGGHLACMLGTLMDANWSTLRLTTEWKEDDPRWQKLPKICGIVGGGAPCDFRDLPIDNTAISYFLGGSRREYPEIYKAASPAEHASPGDVPTLFIHGTQDLIVPIASSRILFEAQKSAGVASKFLPLEGPGHMLTFISPKSIEAAVNFLVTMLVPETANAEN